MSRTRQLLRPGAHRRDQEFGFTFGIKSGTAHLLITEFNYPNALAVASGSTRGRVYFPSRTDAAVCGVTQNPN